MPAADFSKWERANLERFARQAADENKALRERNAQLENDLRTALDAWRRAAAPGASWIQAAPPVMHSPPFL